MSKILDLANSPDSNWDSLVEDTNFGVHNDRDLSGYKNRQLIQEYGDFCEGFGVVIDARAEKEQLTSDNGSCDYKEVRHSLQSKWDQYFLQSLGKAGIPTLDGEDGEREQREMGQLFTAFDQLFSGDPRHSFGSAGLVDLMVNELALRQESIFMVSAYSPKMGKGDYNLSEESHVSALYIRRHPMSPNDWYYQITRVWFSPSNELRFQDDPWVGDLPIQSTVQRRVVKVTTGDDVKLPDSEVPGWAITEPYSMYTRSFGDDEFISDEEVIYSTLSFLLDFLTVL